MFILSHDYFNLEFPCVIRSITYTAWKWQFGWN